MVGATSNYSGISEEPAATTDLPTLNRLTASIQLSWVTTEDFLRWHISAPGRPNSGRLKLVARGVRGAESFRTPLAWGGSKLGRCLPAPSCPTLPPRPCPWCSDRHSQR